jgi:three-Cys-motif partner protein
LAGTFDVIGPWSEVKLDILRDYASPYSRVVAANGFHHLYIDAYAAGGEHISRRTNEIVQGSPRIALSTEPPSANITLLTRTQLG